MTARSNEMRDCALAEGVNSIEQLIAEKVA